MEKRLMNVKELSAYLSMPVPTVYAYVGRGKIPPRLHSPYWKGSKIRAGGGRRLDYRPAAASSHRSRMTTICALIVRCSFLATSESAAWRRGGIRNG